jgi:hypothetical protein
MIELAYKTIGNMNREKAIFLIAGVAFGLTAAFLTGQVQHISEGQASQKLISTLEAQSGQQLEAVSIKSENGLYKIDLSDSQNQLSTYHVTKTAEWRLMV